MQTMSWNVASAPHFATVGHIFEALTGAQIMHTICHFKSWEVRSPMLQTVRDLELKRKSYGCLKTNHATMHLKRRRALSLRSHTKPLTPFHTSLKPSKPIAPVEETMPPKEIIRTEVKVLIQPTQEATTDASAPKDPTITWSSLYFLSLYIIHNSMCWCFILWDWMYYLWYIIYRHHFLFKLGIFLFPLLTNSFVFFFWNMWFLLYDSDSVSLRRYHFLPIFQSLRRSSVIFGLKMFFKWFFKKQRPLKWSTHSSSKDRSSGPSPLKWLY